MWHIRRKFNVRRFWIMSAVEYSMWIATDPATAAYYAAMPERWEVALI